MKQRILGKFKVSAIGLGCMPMSGIPPSKSHMLEKRDQAIATLHTALDAGVTLLDTADIYSPSWNSMAF